MGESLFCCLPFYRWREWLLQSFLSSSQVRTHHLGSFLSLPLMTVAAAVSHLIKPFVQSYFFVGALLPPSQFCAITAFIGTLLPLLRRKWLWVKPGASSRCFVEQMIDLIENYGCLRLLFHRARLVCVIFPFSSQRGECCLCISELVQAKMKSSTKIWKWSLKLQGLLFEMCKCETRGYALSKYTPKWKFTTLNMSLKKIKDETRRPEIWNAEIS